MADTINVATGTAEETRRAWDAIAKGYDSFVTPMHFELGEEGLRHAGLEPGMRFLDVAAGSGALSIPAARLGARVLATDLSPVMLEGLAARAAAQGLDIETRAMDGHALDLDDDTFDMAGSQFGVMLFPDMPRGIDELARVTKPGGRVLMTVFGAPERVEFFGFLMHAIKSVVPGFPGPPDPPPLPFQLRDPERLAEELRRAGLRDVRVESTVEKMEVTSGRQLWDWLISSNPVVGNVLGGLGLSEERRAMIPEKLDQMVAARSGGSGPAVLTSAINIGIGTR